tara:strand:- start:3838 stop:4635 length:798 start_codon:yes stop_codon:yes gene_type:complete
MLFPSLPTDVELYILEFLIMPLDIQTLKKISKKIKKIVNNTKYIIEKNRITDQILMHIEDGLFHEHKSHMNLLDRISLADSWNKYNKWAWNSPTSKKGNNWSIGDFVDVKDKIDIWGPGYIRAIKLEPCEENEIEKYSYMIEFLGWSESFDEWVFDDKIEKLGTKTFNPIEPFQSLRREEYNWVLYKYENVWRIANCFQVTNYKEDSKEDSIKLTIQQFQDRYSILQIIITKNNLHLHLKNLTNISVFLCASGKNLNIYDRKIIM